MSQAWNYGGVEVLLAREEQRLHVFTWVFFLLGLVALPLTASVVALVRFWPVSIPVWVVAATAFWALMLTSAADEPEEV